MQEKKRKAFQEVLIVVASYHSARARLYDVTENNRAAEIDHLRLIDDAISKAEQSRELGVTYSTTNGTLLFRHHGARQWHRWFTNAIAELHAMRSIFEMDATSLPLAWKDDVETGSPRSDRRLSVM